MRYYILVALIFLCPILVLAQKEASNPRIVKMDNIDLKQYYFVMLTRGPERKKVTDTAIINKMQAGHLANIKRLAAEGKILVAGPFDDDGNWRGIFIFDCDSKEETEKLLATDPMIKAGWLAYEIHPWWTGMNEVFK